MCQDFFQINVALSHIYSLSVRSLCAGEIKRLLDQLADQLKEYQNLQDLKVQLDMEIAVYRRLLETEEDRLGLGGQRGICSIVFLFFLSGGCFFQQIIF